MFLKGSIAKIKGREEGFTLVELLIVVAIIAILAAIAIPQFSAYKKRGYVATLNSDVKNAYTAAMAYFADNPGAGIPTCANLTASGYTASSGVTCADADVTITSVGGGGITVRNATWGLTTGAATMSGVGVLTPAVP